MALSPQRTSIDLSGGVATSAAKELVQPPGLLRAENCQYDRAGALTKRRGLLDEDRANAVPYGTGGTPDAIGARPLAGAVSMHDVGESSPLVYDGTQLLGRDTAGNWEYGERHSSVVTVRDPIVTAPLSLFGATTYAHIASSGCAAVSDSLVAMSFNMSNGAAPGRFDGAWSLPSTARTGVFRRDNGALVYQFPTTVAQASPLVTAVGGYAVICGIDGGTGLLATQGYSPSTDSLGSPSQIDAASTVVDICARNTLQGGLPGVMVAASQTLAGIPSVRIYSKPEAPAGAVDWQADTAIGAGFTIREVAVCHMRSSRDMTAVAAIYEDGASRYLTVRVYDRTALAWTTAYTTSFPLAAANRESLFGVGLAACSVDQFYATWSYVRTEAVGGGTQQDSKQNTYALRVLCTGGGVTIVTPKIIEDVLCSRPFVAALQGREVTLLPVYRHWIDTVSGVPAGEFQRWLQGYGQAMLIDLTYEGDPGLTGTTWSWAAMWGEGETWRCGATRDDPNVLFGGADPSVCRETWSRGIPGLFPNARFAWPDEVAVGTVSAGDPLQSVRLETGTLLTGGCQRIYAGGASGLALFPAGPSIIALDAGAAAVPGHGVPAAGTYSYVALFERRDQLGNVIQSAVSAQSTVTLALDHDVDFWIERAWGVEPSQGQITYRIFEDDGTGFVELVPATVWTVSWNGIQISIRRSSGQPLLNVVSVPYTTGGVLDNAGVTSCTCATRWRGRVVIGGLPRRDEVRFTRELLPGIPPQWSEGLSLSAGTGREVVGVAALGDKLLLLCSDAVMYTFGDGPNDAGGGGAFSVPAVLRGGDGCASAQSVVETPAGVVYRSQSTVLLVTYGLQVEDIGAPVLDDLDARPAVLASCYVPADDQVRLLVADEDNLTDTRVLVYDLGARAWTVHSHGVSSSYPTVRRAVAMTRSFGHVWFGDWAGYVAREALDTYDDRVQTGTSATQAFVPMTVQTPWIKLESVEGFQRIWRSTLTGRSDGKHPLTVTVDVDYDEQRQQVSEWSQTAIAELAGAYIVGGRTIRVRMHHEHQACSAVRYTITDEGGEPNTTEGFSLVGLGLEFGVEPGTGRLSPAAIPGVVQDPPS